MNYDYLLKQFTASDYDYRPAMCIPHTFNDYTYASDGHSMMKSPALRTKVYTKLNDKAPNFETFSESNELILKSENYFILKKSDFLEQMAEISISYSYHQITCKECEGKGEKRCNCCDNTNECKYCKGSGTRDDKTSPAIRSIIIEDEEGHLKHYIKVHIIGLSALNAERLLQAMLYFNIDEVKIFYTKRESVCMIEDCFFLFMNYLLPQED